MSILLASVELSEVRLWSDDNGRDGVGGSDEFSDGSSDAERS